MTRMIVPGPWRIKPARCPECGTQIESVEPRPGSISRWEWAEPTRIEPAGEWLAQPCGHPLRSWRLLKVEPHGAGPL